MSATGMSPFLGGSASRELPGRAPDDAQVPSPERESGLVASVLDAAASTRGSGYNFAYLDEGTKR